MALTPADEFLSLGFGGIDWIEHYLVHGPGDVQGQSVELDDEFAAFVVKAYRVDGRGNRKVRRAFLSRPKGRSKSGLAAMLACFEALGPCRFDHFAAAGEVSPWGYQYEEGEPVGRALTYVEILNVATEEGQAGNTYDAIYYMLNPDTCSAELLQDYGKIDVGLTRTNLPDSRGFIEPVTSADSSKDGGKSTFIVADETHLWILPRLKRLHRIMTRNLLKRNVASGWMLETSTMYAAGDDSVAEGTHAYAKEKRRDQTLLFDHRQASDKWDLSVRSERMKALREAYGPASEWMNLGAICDSWDDPQVPESEFRRYWLNQPVPTEEPAPQIFGSGKWAASVDSFTEHAPKKMQAFAVEIDLDREWASIGAAGVRPDGLMHVEVIDRRRGTEWVQDRCVELNRKHGRTGFVIDGGGPAANLVTPLGAAGVTVVVAGTADVAEACAGMVDAVNEGRVAHGPQPELDEAVGGARMHPFRDGGFTFRRRIADTDVTPLVAVTLARWAAGRRPPRARVIDLNAVMREMAADEAKELASRREP